MGFKPDNITCSLCNHSGGAFKKTSEPGGKWVHCLCANWLPELYEVADQTSNSGPTVRIDALEKGRKGLKCSACSGKGGCLQCFHSSCKAAIHPRCVLKQDSGYSWRVIESSDKDGNPMFVRELYCARHQDDVGLPLKKEGDMLIQVGTLTSHFQ